jgi:predicted RNase H-like HicB family nuclease
MTTYAVIYEQAQDGTWSARAADLPAYASGATRDEAETEIRGALELLLDEFKREGRAIPEARSVVGTVSV